MFRIIEPIDQIVEGWRKDYVFEYQSFNLKTCLMVKNKFLQIFIGLDVGKGYSNVSLVWNGAIINRNGNRCKVVKYTYNYPDSPGLFGNASWVEISKLESYVSVKGKLEINVTITDCDFKHNESKMIQGIYEKLFGQEDFYLIKYKNTISNLQSELKNSNEINEHLSVLIESMSIKENTPAPASSSTSSTSSVATPASLSVTNGDLKIKSINVDELDTDKLAELQESIQELQIKITKRIKDLETCGVCMTNKINCIIIPCGHRYCVKCVETVQKNENKCPSCRKMITSYHKTY